MPAFGEVIGAGKRKLLLDLALLGQLVGLVGIGHFQLAGPVGHERFFLLIPVFPFVSRFLGGPGGGGRSRGIGGRSFAGFWGAGAGGGGRSGVGGLGLQFSR